MRLTTPVILLTALAALELSAQERVPLPEQRVPKTRAVFGAPPGLLIVVGTPSTATLTWQAPAGAMGFEVLRAVAPSGNWVKLHPMPFTVTSFTDASGFILGQAYVYRVLSLFAEGPPGIADVRFQPPPPPNPGWVRAGQKGQNVEVGWEQVPGATRYKIIGGSPVGSAGYREITAPTNITTFHNVAPGSYQWNVGAIFDPGGMETSPTHWPGTSLLVVNAAARFRVIITGVTVLRKTRDDRFHYDGMDDEIFVAGHAIVFNRQNGAVISTYASKSQGYGDTNNPPRHLAGTSSFHGGINTGDVVPAGDPTKPLGPVTSTKLPLLVFDGTLTEGIEDVLIFPSVWEMDHGNGTLYGDWLSRVPQLRLSGTQSNPSQYPYTTYPVYFATGEFTFSAGSDLNLDPLRMDRPIGHIQGKSLAGGVFPYRVKPQGFWLQREDLERRLAMATVTSNGRLGIQLSIDLVDIDESQFHPVSWGNYLLHLWIEKVP